MPDSMGRLNNLLGIVTNIAVIVGIGFLVIEIEQKAKLLRAEASLKMLENRLSIRTQAIESPEFAMLIMKGTSGQELTPLERYRLTARIHSTILGWEWEYQQYLE
jgi:hypothetical protein